MNHADAAATVQFQTLDLKELGEPEFDWTKQDFLDALNKHGMEGWEVSLSSERAVLFRKERVPQRWEYKVVKTTSSPLASRPSGGASDPDAFTLILERLKTEAWTPCTVSSLGDHILYKRLKNAEDSPATSETVEFQSLPFAKLVSSELASAYTWGQTEFLEGLNKQGAEVCLSNPRGVLLQKRSGSKKWDYKAVKVSTSPLAKKPYPYQGVDDEVEAFTLILERLEADGWKPCAVGGSLDRELLFKRSKSE